MFTKRDFSERGRRRLYLILDCETATLPFANEIARNEKEKKNIAIARPLIYDLGWKIVDSQLNVYTEKSFLITEIFSVPQVFNTAYYRDKRPIYLEKLRKGEISLKTWSEAADLLLMDLRLSDFCCAYNAMFDFKKAIPFTEIYNKKLYSDNYQEWENNQRAICQRIARGEKSSSSREFDPDHFFFHGEKFPVIDLWGVACESLINNQTYKRECLKNRMITESGFYFKTSAESTYRYLLQKYSFEEAHTAIEDVTIESIILHRALKKGKISHGIMYFPFQNLGTTKDFLKSKPKGIKKEEYYYVISVMKDKLETYETNSTFATQLENSIYSLEKALYDRFREV